MNEVGTPQSQDEEYDPSRGPDIATINAAESAPMEDEDDEEEYDPSTAFADVEDDVQSQSLEPGSASRSAANTPSLTADDALKPPPADTSATRTPTPAKQVRTKGGFVDESEDDEEDIPVTKPKAVAALPSASGSPKRSDTFSPNNTHHPQKALPSISAQDQTASGVFPSPVPDFAAASVSISGTPVPNATKPAPQSHSVTVTAQVSAAPTPISSSLPKSRLPQDKVGILEDRIAEDPRGDIEAWLGLIDEYRKRSKYDEARAVYERFFQTFPTAAEQWVQYVDMETELDNFGKVEQIFGRSITTNPYLGLWSSYISYIRRINNLTTDHTGQARTTLTQVYEFVLDKIGIDVDAGQIWTDYIDFLKSAPGSLGGTNWQDKQKMDNVRKVYQRAVSVPTNATLDIWRDWDRFEMGLNKVTGRKNLQEKSASYMTARAAINVLGSLTKDVNRTTLPKLPPAAGFDGAEEYMRQVQAWTRWIEYEKSDPLDVREDDRTLYNKRVLFIYKNALMALRFWPEMWYDAAEWSYENDLKDEGDQFLKDGTDANPESALLAFKRAHQVELRTDFEDGEAGVIKKGETVREPLTKLLDALYDLTTKAKKREDQTIARAKDVFAAQQAAEEAARADPEKDTDDDEDAEEEAREAAKRVQAKQAMFDAQVHGIKRASEAEIHTLKKSLSYAWIALMRAMRRIQGKGSPGAAVGGFRGVFAEARKRGKLLSDAYVASALIEHHCYQDPAASKIFERGMKLFPDDENFALEYIKHLVKLNDSTNARAVFETIISRLTSKPEIVGRAKPLFVYIHDYESQFGELAQVVKLEQRMATLFPEDPHLSRFASRFSSLTFDPTTVRPIISPRTQMRPVMPASLMPPASAQPTVVPTVEEPAPLVPPPVSQPEQRGASPAILNSPRLAHLPVSTNSPKRPLEDVDSDLNQPRKFLRGESPLKGAAGRRLNAARMNQAAGGNTPIAAVPAPLPRGVNFLFTILPGAHTYHETRFNPEKMVDLLRNVNIPVAPGAVPTSGSMGAPQGAPNPLGPPAMHIGTQLQNIQARFGGAAGPHGWS